MSCFVIRIFKMLSCLIPMCLFSCGINRISSGGGTDFPNTIIVVGMIQTPDTLSASATEIKLVPADFNCISDSLSKIRIDTTDFKGYFKLTIPVADTGIYNILACNLQSRQRAFKGSIHVRKETTEVAPLILGNPGTISICIPDTSYTRDAYVYLLGTDIKKHLIASTGLIIMDSIPAGVMPPLCYFTPISSKSQQICDSVDVKVGEITFLPHALWGYARRLIINTTPSGAGISTTVTHFPMLVRLTKNNFDFSQAQGNGQDVRFTDINNRQLPFQIEEWDPVVNMRASIWVLVDSILGNDSTQYITLYWGNSKAMDISMGSNVFNNADGMIGVYHLKKDIEGIGAQDAYKDATGNGFNGTGYVSDPDADGIIGMAQRFDGVDDYIDLLNRPQLNLASSFTISAWVETEWKPVTQDHQYLIDKCDNSSDSARKGYSLLLHFEQDYYKARIDLFSSPNGSATTLKGTKLVGTGWKFLTAIFDGSTLRIYEQGVETASLSWNNPPLPNDASLRIGRRNGNSIGFFKGKIDEVRICRVVLPADYIKLSFETQKEGSTVLMEVRH